MKKFLMALCALVFTTSVSADIKYDKNYEKNTLYTPYSKFYSSWMVYGTYPQQYHELFRQTINQIRQLARNKSNTNEKIEKEIVCYLTTLNSYVSLQLLHDITKNGFYSGILLLSDWAVCGENRAKYIYDAFKDDCDNTSDLNEFATIMDQVIRMIITCWNNGTYGKDVYDQVISFLKSVGTPIAYEFMHVWRL